MDDLGVPPILGNSMEKIWEYRGRFLGKLWRPQCFPSLGTSFFFLNREIIRFYGRTIQGSDMLQFA